jgi:hypothetical protein
MDRRKALGIIGIVPLSLSFDTLKTLDACGGPATPTPRSKWDESGADILQDILRAREDMRRVSGRYPEILMMPKGSEKKLKAMGWTLNIDKELSEKYGMTVLRQGK